MKFNFGFYIFIGVCLGFILPFLINSLFLPFGKFCEGNVGCIVVVPIIYAIILGIVGAILGLILRKS